MAYQIKDWGVHFENAKSRKLTQLAWVPFPNSFEGKGFARVVRHRENGAEIFGIFVLVVELASKMPVRGLLVDDDGAMSDQDIADVIGRPLAEVQGALSVLTHTSISWVEVVDQWQIVADDGGRRETMADDGTPREKTPLNKKEKEKEKKKEAAAAAAAAREPLSAEEWADESPAELAQRFAMQLARPMSRAHWCPSDVPKVPAAIQQVLSTSVNPEADAKSMEANHQRWRAAFDAGLLDRDHKKKRLQWWIADGLWMQDPPTAAVTATADDDWDGAIALEQQREEREKSNAARA